MKWVGEGMAKVVWSKDIPTQDGWYWIRYQRRGETLVLPCRVFCAEHFTAVRTMGNDLFAQDLRRGPGLYCKGKLNKSVRFGPELVPPV